MKIGKYFKSNTKYYTPIKCYFKELFYKFGILESYNSIEYLYLFLCFIIIILASLFPNIISLLFVVYRLYELSVGVVYKYAFPKEKEVIYKGRALVLAIYSYIEYLLLFAALYVNIDPMFRMSDFISNALNALMFSSATMSSFNATYISNYSKVFVAIESIIKTLYIALFIYYALLIYFQGNKPEKK